MAPKKEGKGWEQEEQEGDEDNQVQEDGWCFLASQNLRTFASTWMPAGGEEHNKVNVQGDP